MQYARIAAIPAPDASGTEPPKLRTALAAWFLVATAAFSGYCSLVLHHDAAAVGDLLAGLVLPGK